MTFATHLAQLESLAISPASFPHGSNLQTKCRGNLRAAQTNALTLAAPAYCEVHAASKRYESGALGLRDFLSIFDAYYDLIKTPEVNCFSHQSDFLSSLLPELICVLLRRILCEDEFTGQGLVVTAQKDIFIECNFDICGGGRLIEKRKRMDVALLAPGALVFNGRTIDFWIPALCAEVKTNIDKNMLSGIESSVETLKRTFPRTKYYAIGEFSDFELSTQNYASTGIDEILIVRHQRRSVVRRDPGARNQLSESLLSSFIDEIRSHIATTKREQPNLATRMNSGRLT